MSIRVLYERRFVRKLSEEGFFPALNDIILALGTDYNPQALRIKIVYEPSLSFLLECVERQLSLFFDPKATKRLHYERSSLPYQYLSVTPKAAILDDRYFNTVSGHIIQTTPSELSKLLAVAQLIRPELVDLGLATNTRHPGIIFPFLYLDHIIPNPAYTFDNYFRVTADDKTSYVSAGDYVPRAGQLTVLFPRNTVRLSGETLHRMILLSNSGELQQDLFTTIGSQKSARFNINVEVFEGLKVFIRAGNRFGTRMFV
jgi:hypothetical protein